MCSVTVTRLQSRLATGRICHAPLAPRKAGPLGGRRGLCVDALAVGQQPIEGELRIVLRPLEGDTSGLGGRQVRTGENERHVSEGLREIPESFAAPGLPLIDA